MTPTILERRGLTRLAVLSLPVAAAIVLPSVAMAASGGSTVRATVGADGSVKSVKVYAPGGGAAAFTDNLPLKLSISRTVSGSTSTYTYHVENTFSKQQTVTYTDTAGKSRTASTELQLPLVGQLGIQLPNTFKSVSAPNGVVQTDPDGVNRILFNLVLFSPLGAPTQDVTFTATGSGAPTAELVATTVNPSATAGLSSASQAANATAQQDDFWTSFATGGNGGLTQLADGVGKMVAGLTALAPGAHKLADGLKAAVDGANKLDAGTKSAYTGSKQLSTGIGQIHDGNTSLASGLGLINGGLAPLDGKTPASAGLQGAVDGITAIEAGLKLVLIGLQGVGGTVAVPTDANPTTTPPTPSVLKGLAQVKGGVDLVRGPLFNDLLTLQGLTSPFLADGTTPNSHFDLTFASMLNPASPTFDPALAAWITQLSTDLGTAGLPAGLFPVGDPRHAGGALAQASAGLSGLIAGVGQITTGLNAHTPGTFGSTDKGGIDYGLLALLDAKAGLPAAVAGVDQLFTGSGAALDGAKKLATGSGTAFTGSQALASGLSQLSAGQHQVATGLPAAVTGAGQIADGADQLKDGAVAVKAGILAVQSGAVGPLLQQLTDGSQNSKKQLAILDAAGALASQAPGGAGTAYVLSQSPNGFRLAASTSSSGDSHTGRNVGIGVGGLAALLIAVGAGFFVGRRSSVSV
jgi:putative membrane protein